MFTHTHKIVDSTQGGEEMARQEEEKKESTVTFCSGERIWVPRAGAKVFVYES